MTIQRIHHVQITIPAGEEDTAREFYCGLLGLSEIPKPSTLQHKGGFWIQLGDLQIHLGIQDTIDRHQYRGHIAYQVDDVQAWRDTLKNHNIEIIESIPIEGFDRFEFRDPFGNRIEMIQTVTEDS